MSEQTPPTSADTQKTAPPNTLKEARAAVTEAKARFLEAAKSANITDTAAKNPMIWGTAAGLLGYLSVRRNFMAMWIFPWLLRTIAKVLKRR